MSDILRERVVAEMMASVGCERLDNTEWRAYCLMADAAIALIRAEVLEMAAKVAENYDGPGMESAPDATWGDAQATKDDIAYYIRALKEKA